MTVPAMWRIDIIRGQALDIEVTVPDGVDLTQATAEFGIAPEDNKPYSVMLPASIAGQVITAELSGTESALLTLPRHYYSCWIVVAGDPTPVARGYFRIDSDSRNR